MEPFGVTSNCNSLISWNNPFGVDVPLTEKPALHKQTLKTVPEGNLK